MIIRIPLKTKIFLAAFWLWTWILFQFNKACAMVLGSILTHMPNEYIPRMKDRTPVRVICAHDERENDITNKMRLFLNTQWNHTVNDGRGGVYIEQFAKQIGTTIIYMAYIFDYDFDPKYSDFIESTQQPGRPSKAYKEAICNIIIDIGTKIVLSERWNRQTEKSSLLFGGVSFD